MCNVSGTAAEASLTIDAPCRDGPTGYKYINGGYGAKSMIAQRVVLEKLGALERIPILIAASGVE